MGEPLERFQVGALVQHPIVNPFTMSQRSLCCMLTCAHVVCQNHPDASSSSLDQRNRKSSPRGRVVDTSSILREGYTGMQSCIWAAFSLFPAQKLGILFLLFYSLLFFSRVSSCFSSQLPSCSAERVSHLCVSSCYGTGNPKEPGEKSGTWVVWSPKYAQQHDFGDWFQIFLAGFGRGTFNCKIPT